MHLVFYGRNLLDVHGFSTGISVAILVGAGYGLLRLAYDVVMYVVSGGGYRRSPGGPPRE